MMCYRDMTFCPFWESCSDGGECGRALTQSVLDAAEKWMKNPPIAQYVDKPECFKTIGENHVSSIV